MPSDNSFLKNEETVTKFLALSSADYDRYKSDRDSIGFDDNMELADGMWRCMQNRSLGDTERVASSNAPDNRANVGSVRFFRTVSQKASLGYSVSSSVEVPWNYKPRSNSNVWNSDLDSLGQAAVHNSLARYAWREGECDRKMYEFWTQIHKYCNVPVQVLWNERHKRIATFDKETSKREFKDVVTDVFPTFRTLHWSMLFADAYIPKIKDQNCVIILSIVPWIDIQNGVKAGWYDKDMVEEIRANMQKYRWDGAEGTDFRKAQMDNAGGGTYSPGESELFLIWDIYRWVPVSKGKWDEEKNDYTLYWCSCIGNSINDSKIIRADIDFDPDGEIPIEFIHVIPDDNEMLYSMSWSQVVRNAYSIESTLWEQTIDNISGVNNPILLYNSLLFNSKPSNFAYQPGSRVDVNDVDGALREFVPRDTTAQTAQLIQLIQDEQGVASSLNQNMLGQSYGGRTPASESIAINRFSQQPNLAETSYILNQLTRFLAKKFKSYFQAFGDPKMIHMIADEMMSGQIPVPAEAGGGVLLYGDFDIETNLADQFIEDYVAAGQEIQLLQSIAANPQLLSSQNHKVDIGEWLRVILQRMKISNASAIIKPVSNIDARLRQRDEITLMIQTKQLIQPQDGEDHDAHLVEINAALMEWKPLAPTAEFGEMDAGLQKDVEFARFVIQELLIPHRDAHMQMKQQEGMQAVAQQQQMQQMQAPQTPGQEAGNVMSEQLGAL